jgi:Synaptobrevin
MFYMLHLFLIIVSMSFASLKAVDDPNRLLALLQQAAQHERAGNSTEVARMKNEVVDGIVATLDSGKRTALLPDKTEQLQQDAFRFKQMSQELRRKMGWRRLLLLLQIKII